MSSDNSPLELDISRAPRGELAAAQLVTAAAQIGDVAERHYLELKGPPNLSSKAAKHKIAKFILGAANRLDGKAAEAFEGCAVMIIGVTAHGIEGVPPVEMMELSKVIEPFLGVPGPAWDIVRVPVEGSDRQVLLVIVEPPQPHQPVYICRDNGEGLADGRVYIRGEGTTREATSAEQDAMRVRAEAPVRGAVALAVSLAGAVVPFAVDDERTLEEYVRTTQERLLAALPPETPRGPIVIKADDGTSPSTTDPRETIKSYLAASGQRAFDNLGPLGVTPERRTREQYRAEIDDWEAAVRAEWPEVLATLAGYVSDVVEVRIVNLTTTFLHDVEVAIHLDGDVQSVEYLELPDRVSDIDLAVPDPPREWGPTSPSPFGPLGMPDFLHPDLGAVRVPRSTWTNTGSVHVVVDVGDLRPEGSFTTDDEESALVVFGLAPESVSGSWRVTARGYDEVFHGALTVSVGALRDLTKPLRRLLRLGMGPSEGTPEA